MDGSWFGGAACPAPAGAMSEDDGYPFSPSLLRLPMGDPRYPDVNAAGASSPALEVRVAVRIHQILAIGAVANTFRCAFDLLLEWEDETFAPVLRRERPFGAIEWRRHWRPRWSLLNAVEIAYLADDSQAHLAVAAHRDTGRCVVRQTRRVVGTFFEHMALAAFPLDVQALSLVVACEMPQAAVRFVDGGGSTFDGSRWAPKLAEWVFLARDAPSLPLAERTPFTRTETQSDAASLDAPRSLFVAQMPVRRRVGYYLVNVVAVYFCIVAFGWLGFANATDDTGNRFNFLAALLLTSVSFKYLFKERLPKVEYLTALDVYVYAVMLALGAQGLVHVWARAEYAAARDNGAAARAAVTRRERYALCAMAFGWVSLHAAIVVAARRFERDGSNWSSAQLRDLLDRQKANQQLAWAAARGAPMRPQSEARGARRCSCCCCKRDAEPEVLEIGSLFSQESVDVANDGDASKRV